MIGKLSQSVLLTLNSASNLESRLASHSQHTDAALQFALKFFNFVFPPNLRRGLFEDSIMDKIGLINKKAQGELDYFFL